MPNNSYHHIDPQVLLQAVAGDIDAFCSMAHTYLRIAPPMLARLRQAAAAGDVTALAYDSHALKGSAALVGAARLAQLLAQIEGRSRNGERDSLAPLLAELEPEFHQVMREVQASIADCQGGAP